MSVKNKLKNFAENAIDKTGKMANTVSEGIKGVASIPSDIKYIKNKNKEIAKIIEEANTRVEPIREKTNKKLEEFGQIKLKIIDTILGEFNTNINSIENLPLDDSDNDLTSHNNFSFSKKELKKMQVSVLSIKEILKNSTGAGVIGVAGAGATYTAIAALGAASTGTIISSLSGVAATNATLAWLGGGALAVGGGGMALGAVVLGGIAVVPAVAFLIYKGKFDYTDERKEVDKNYSEAILFTESMNDIVKNFEEMIKLIDNTIILANKFSTECNKLNKQTDHIINKVGSNYDQYSDEQKGLIEKNVVYATGLSSLLNTPIMNENGSVNKSMADILTKSQEFLNNQAEIVFIDYKKKTSIWIYVVPVVVIFGIVAYTFLMK